MSARRGPLAAINDRIWMLRRATAVPTLLRTGLGLAAVAGLSLGFARPGMPPGAYAVLVAVGLVTALAPRTLMPTAVILVSAVGWLISGSDYSAPGGFFRLWALAVLLYTVHSAAAMAAVLPYDALVTAGTFQPWLRRAGLVAALTGLVAFAIAELPGLIGGHRQVLASIIGLCVTLAIAGYLTMLGRRQTRAGRHTSRVERGQSD
jgi:hypothetical protein